MEIFYTKHLGEIGKVPEFIDPSVHEYKADDVLNGFIFIENTSSLEIPFYMFYVLFEGNFMVTVTRNVKIKKVLEMFDFSASWSGNLVYRLITETEKTYKCANSTDPVDGAYLRFSGVRVLKPNSKYKKFFTFKIPGKLLDYECNEHILSSNIELPPSLGTPRYEDYYYKNKVKVSDISFIDSSITYSVFARFMGRSSIYGVDLTNHPIFNKIINAKGDEYIVFKETDNFIRMIPDSTKHSDGELIMKLHQDKILFENLVNRIKEKIRIAGELAQNPKNKQRTHELERSISCSELLLAKNRQLYRHDNSCNSKELNEYHNYLDLKKGNYFGILKSIATLKLSTPRVKVLYKISTASTVQNVSVDDYNSWKLKLPIILSFMSGNNNLQYKTLPHIKSVKSILNVLTFKSEKYPILLEISHEFFINKYDPEETSTIETHYSKNSFKKQIIKKFQVLFQTNYIIILKE